MRLTLRHGYLPANLDGALFVAPFREDAKNIYNAGGGIDAAAPATETVDADGSYVDPGTGLITSASANVLRIGSGIDLALRKRGALLEGARENTCLQSEDWSNASWVKTRTTASVNALASPDGTLTADKLVEDATASSSHFAQQAISLTNGQKVVFSVFAKKGERTEVKLQADGVAVPGGSAVSVWFDLDAGTKGTVSAGIDDSGMDDMGNGWYRCWLVFTADATDTANLTIVLGSGSETGSYNGDNSSGLYLWGAQCEENARFPGSYIKTVAAPVTRAADVLNYDNTGEVNLSKTAGTVYIAVTPEWDIDSTWETILDARTEDQQNGFFIARHTSNKFRLVVMSDNVAQADLLSSASPSRGTSYVLACVWDTDDFRLYVDGIEDANDTSGAVPTAVGTEINVGINEDQAGGAHVHLAHLHIYDSAHIASRVLENTNEIKRWMGL